MIHREDAKNAKDFRDKNDVSPRSGVCPGGTLGDMKAHFQGSNEGREKFNGLAPDCIAKGTKNRTHINNLRVLRVFAMNSRPPSK
jgi:hypothetical protein